MSSNASHFLKSIFSKNNHLYRVLFVIGSLIVVVTILAMTSSLLHLYLKAYLGDSEAMYLLGRDYYNFPSEFVLKPNGDRGAYWLRKAMMKGNLHAIKYFEIGWGRVKPHEVVIYLEKGTEFGHPWCAEQLARGYRFGLYGLKVNPQKEAEYREIGAKLRKEGKISPDE